MSAPKTTATLTRFCSEPCVGTFGRFEFGGMCFYSVERPWRNNEPRVSCIPAGTYRLGHTMFHRGGYETFEVCDVPNRSRILIHIANTPGDVEGCIGLGLRLGISKASWAVLDSRKAFAEFMAACSTGLEPRAIRIVDPINRGK